jgi:hypothetical protein
MGILMLTIIIPGLMLQNRATSGSLNNLSTSYSNSNGTLTKINYVYKTDSTGHYLQITMNINLRAQAGITSFGRYVEFKFDQPNQILANTTIILPPSSDLLKPSFSGIEYYNGSLLLSYFMPGLTAKQIVYFSNRDLLKSHTSIEFSEALSSSPFHYSRPFNYSFVIISIIFLVIIAIILIRKKFSNFKEENNNEKFI